MKTRVRRVMALAAILLTSMLMTMSNVTTAQADWVHGNSQTGSVATSGTVATSGQVITVMVSGSGYAGGSSGSGGGGAFSVGVPAPCWMSAAETGSAYYQWVASGQMSRDMRHSGDSLSPRQGYAGHKNDGKGQWWVPICDPGNWPNPSDFLGFGRYVDQFWAAHPVVYLPAAQTPPAPPVTPELLRAVAIKNLRLPDPRLDWNPKRLGTQGTLVNLDTWLWLDNPPATESVTAAVAGSGAATVTARFAGMDITAPGESPLSCAGPGTAYSVGAHPTCVLVFARASSALGLAATPVTAAARWSATWTFNGAGQGPIPTQPAPVAATANIAVDEVQTLVTGAQ